jgi:hypothetical protein
MKKKYQSPTLELFPTEPFYLLEGSKKSGYAIDNDDANDDNIIPFIEGPTPSGEEGEDDEFIDID